jgi:acetate kinase
MRQELGPLVLAVNSGSSSLKVGLFCHRDGDISELLRGSVSGIGRESGKLQVVDASGARLIDERYTLASQDEALGEMIRVLAVFSPGPIAAVGHRVVHGGPRLTSHQKITPEVLQTLQKSVHFAPLHIPAALSLIRETEKLLPGVPQFACFDTAFHTTLPEVACHYALPESLYRQGLRRYGFHGLAYESIVHQLRAERGPLPQRLICAHLGSGASLAAIENGRSIDTSMGLTPLGGIPMATRPGDLDPGVAIFLLRNEQLTADQLESLLNHEAGLRALSGGETDMQALVEARSQGDARSALAVEAFAMGVRKFIGAYAAVLGGVDLLVFSGGIGEHSEVVRRLCCQGLEYLGITPKDAANPGADGPEKGKVRVIEAQEERQIARHWFRRFASEPDDKLSAAALPQAASAD